MYRFNQPIVMIKNFLLVLTFFGILSCNEKIVQLPETSNNTITKVLDVSPAYLFYDEEQDSVEFNRKNLIGTTNWLVNVDKRLTLKQIMPHIIYLQNKRKKAGMHKNESAKNYFSCSNPDIKNLAFIDFTNVEYQLKKESQMTNEPGSCYLLFSNSNEVEIMFPDKNLKADADTFLSLLKNDYSRVKEDSLTLSLAFNENLKFQDYISYKSKLLELDFEMFTISKTELIYN